MFTEVITQQIESELKFKNLVEKSLVGVYILQDGCLVYVNPAYCNSLGYPEEELLGKEANQIKISKKGWNDHLGRTEQHPNIIQGSKSCYRDIAGYYRTQKSRNCHQRTG
jgi:PAS domain S-box-containing protein